MAETRDAILGALAEVVVEEGVGELSVQQVADRAGVSHRTVYRHFSDRQGLLDALADRVQQRLEEELGEAELEAVEDHLGAVERYFGRFDDLGASVEAMVRISFSEDIRSARHRDRTGRFREVFEPELSGLDDPEAVFAVVRHLMSSPTWWVLHREFGLDGARAGRAVVTVLRALLAHAETENSSGDSGGPSTSMP